MTKATAAKPAAKKNMDVAGTTPDPKPAFSQEKRRPLKTFSEGGVNASVWARDHLIRGESRRFFSVTFERSYRDAAGQYRYTRSFNPDDLGTLMALCQQAGEYINRLQDLTPATAED